MIEGDNKTLRFCGVCSKFKETLFCVECGRETKSFYSRTCNEISTISDGLRNLMKSVEKTAQGKPVKEVEQYVGNKDPLVVSEFQRTRIRGVTEVIHRLWRQFDKGYKKVHEHKK